MRRLFTVFTLIFVLFVSAAPSGTASTSTYLTRLRLFLDSDSDWSAIHVKGASVRARHIVSATPGATVLSSGDGFVLLGNPAAATVDVVMHVPSGASPSVQLPKDKYGSAFARVTRTNVGSVVLAELNNHSTQGNATVSKSVSRSTLIGEGLKIPTVDPRRLVLAFYFPWFGHEFFTSGLWHDKPAAAYNTWHPESVAQMVGDAANGGINGFIVSWDGVPGHDGAFDLVVDAARARGDFAVTPLMELLAFKTDAGFNVDAIESEIRKVLQRASDPTFLHVGSRPVVFVFGIHQLGATGWNDVVQRLAATGDVPFFVGEAFDPSFGLEGVYRFNPNGIEIDKLRNLNFASAYSARMDAQVNPAAVQRLWAATVSPGENNSYHAPMGQSVNEPRKDGARYDGTWSAALPSAPEWILVNSWNEWFEATHVTPSQKYGSRALTQTKSWSAYFKNPAPASGSSNQGGLLPWLPIKVNSLQ